MKPLIRLFYNLFLKADSFPDPSSIEPNSVKNILVVRQHNQLGDMLCSLPLFAALKNKFVNSKITLVCSDDNKEIFNSPDEKYIDEIILYNKSGLLSLYDFYRDLKLRKYDIGIVPSTVSFSKTSHIINALAKPKLKAGVSNNGILVNEYDFMLDIKGSFLWNDEKKHQALRNIDIVKPVGASLSPEKVEKLHLHLSENEKKEAQEFLKKHLPLIKRYNIGFHPGAGKPPNRWSVENFAAIMEMLSAKYECNFIITSGPHDTETVTHLTDILKKKNIDFAVASGKHIRVIAALIHELDLYVTNDTGTMHVSGAVNTKTISIFGPTLGWEWAPLGKQNIFIQSVDQDINSISVEEVYNKCIQALEQ
ncbi:glycosyltransferase family 9 protein [soil metagenome]